MTLPTHSRKGSVVNGTALQEATAMLGTSPPLSLSMSMPMSMSPPPPPPPASTSTSTTATTTARPIPASAHPAGGGVHQSNRSIPFPSPPMGNGPAGYVDKDPKDGGPARLPTPMTVCDIHQIMEQEQEQLVNRALRSHVTSPASSACSSLNDLSDPSAIHHHHHHHHRPPHPVISRDRSHSNISTISLTGGTGVSGIAPSRDTTRDGTSVIAAHSPSSVPHYLPQDQRLQDQLHNHYHNHNHHHRHNPSSSSITSIHGPLPAVDLRLNTNLRNAPPGEAVTSSPSSAIPRRSSITSTAAGPAGPAPFNNNSSMLSAGLYKSELESVKKDNEMLKRRVRELENMVKQLKVSSSSSSASTTQSSSSTTTGSKNEKSEQNVQQQQQQQQPAVSSSSSSSSPKNGGKQEN